MKKIISLIMATLMLSLAFAVLLVFTIFLITDFQDGLVILTYTSTAIALCFILVFLGLTFVHDVKESKPETHEEILWKSNVIQFDEMGSPLRLCIVRTNKEPFTDQVWLDTTQRPNDVVLEWEKKQ